MDDADAVSLFLLPIALELVREAAYSHGRVFSMMRLFILDVCSLFDFSIYISVISFVNSNYA